MSNQVTNDPDHDEIVSLLPWFVNQTLDAHQRRAVSSHIENCDDCQREIQFLETLTETVQNDVLNNYSEHADIDKSFSNVMNRINDNSLQGNAVTPSLSWLQQQLGKTHNFATSLTTPQWGATALAGLLVVALGFQIIKPKPDDNYSVLSSSNINDTSIRLSVEASGTDNQELVRLDILEDLGHLGQQVDIESTTDGVYIVVIKESIGVSELSKLITTLESQPTIERVEIMP